MCHNLYFGNKIKLFYSYSSFNNCKNTTFKYTIVKTNINYIFTFYLTGLIER